MAAVAIYSADPKLRHRLERLLRGVPTIALVGIADDLQALARLLAHSHVDAVLVDAPSRKQLKDWLIRHRGVAFIALVDDADASGALDALHAGATAIVSRSADRAEIAVAIEAAIGSFVILPRHVLATLLDPGSSHQGELLHTDNIADGVPLTPRELEVLAAMADGASNKAIARRLGISFHTAKFHVAAILAKLDADSRTEAVARAAHLGLVML
jgi:DNA-binding NarL/FixJ family response regulator